MALLDENKILKRLKQIILLYEEFELNSCGPPEGQENNNSMPGLHDETGYCPEYYDSVLCWPKSPANATVSLLCPDELFGISHMTHYNVTRHCLENSTWSKANYTGCTPVLRHSNFHLDMPEEHFTIMYFLYWIGYCSSLFFLIVALAIFQHYKSLRCMRNIIHGNLILCFTLHDIVWIAYAIIAREYMVKGLQRDKIDFCLVPTITIKYLTICEFFWMFIEGIYLFVSVTSSLRTNLFRYWMCASLGWGLPIVITITANLSFVQTESTLDCWLEQRWLSLIYTLPILIVLVANVLILLAVMYVVFNRLQMTVRLEAVKYKKAVKALIILSPLLGINYFTVIFQSSVETMWIKILLAYFQTITSSFQGLLVAIFFCFGNNEVRMLIKKTIFRWRRRVRRNSPSSAKDSLYSNSDNHKLEMATTRIFMKDYQKFSSVESNSFLNSTPKSLRKYTPRLQAGYCDSETENNTRGFSPSVNGAKVCARLVNRPSTVIMMDSNRNGRLRVHTTGRIRSEPAHPPEDLISRKKRPWSIGPASWRSSERILV